MIHFLNIITTLKELSPLIRCTLCFNSMKETLADLKEVSMEDSRVDSSVKSLTSEATGFYARAWRGLVCRKLGRR